MKKYFETKDGSLEAVSTKIAQEQPTITKPEPNVKLERKTYFENKPGSLEDAAAKVVSEGLDPVNKDAVKKKFDDRKDKDIDNDGDVDSSDKFLHKRRKAISKAMKEDLGKEDEKSVKDVIKGLKKATQLHGKQAASLSKALKNEELGKEDTPKVNKIISKLKKASGAHASQAKDLEKAVKEYVGVNVDDKGEVINTKKDGNKDPKRGEKALVDPEPKIKDVIKGEKETTRANGHMTKKRFSEMRVKLGQKGKTDTGKDAAVVETEPKVNPI